MKHRDICAPVAAQLRLAGVLACAAQVLKLAIWLVMLGIAHMLAASRIAVASALAVALLVLCVLYYTLKIRAHDQSHYAAYHLEEILRERISAKIARLPLGTVRTWGAGGLAKVLIDDVHALHSYVADAPPLRAEAYVTPPLVLAALVCLDPWLAWWSALFCLASFAALAWLFRRGRHFRREYGKALAEVNRAIIEYVQGMATVRTFDHSGTSFARYRTALAAYDRTIRQWLAQSGWVTRLARALFTPMPILIFLLLLALVYPAGVQVWLAYFLLAAGIVETMHPYMGLYHLLDKSRAAIERIAEVEALPELTVAAKPQALRGYDIRCENITFHYPDNERAAIEALDLVIPGQSFTALIGASGSGKTTLAGLLCRFHDVSEGRILLGGTDIRTLSPAELFASFSFVFQDNFLFSSSIADNIRLGMTEADDAAVMEAARQAEIHDTIMRLPQGYETRAGERGQLLSGGERQRIAIARAFLQNRPVLVLDEPTAFADARNEALLHRAFRALRKGRTVIMIAHRLHRIVDADQIVLLDHGRLVACGRHEALLAGNAPYRELWQDYRAARAWTMPVAPRKEVR